MRTVFGRITGPAVQNFPFYEMEWVHPHLPSLGQKYSAPETSIFINTTRLQSPES